MNYIIIFTEISFSPETSNLMQTFENLLLQNISIEFLDIAHNSPWACVIKVCSNGISTYIIAEIIAKKQFEHS